MTVSKGRILQLQRYSVNDGDGIRTTIFFAGCPLRCRWCANPEGYERKNRIMYIASRCIQCGHCETVCPKGIGIDLSDEMNRLQCDGCGLCADECPANARKRTVTDMTVADIMKALESHALFFRNSGGGVTYSGGECTAQPEFLDELTEAVYDRGFDQAMETSAYFDLNRVQHILDRIDLLFTDIKHMDPAMHKRWTGADNERILSNIAAIGAKRRGMVVRVPTIIGINGDDDNIRRTAQFVKKHLQDPCMELLPYHPYGEDKYTQLGMPYDSNQFRTPDAEELRHLNGIIESEGVRVVSYK